jgi:hypothetical protein
MLTLLEWDKQIFASFVLLGEEFVEAIKSRGETMGTVEEVEASVGDGIRACECCSMLRMIDQRKFKEV